MPIAVLEVALRVLESILRLIVLHLEATPAVQRAAVAARWNIFWARVLDVLLKPLGIDLPAMPEIPEEEEKAV